MTHQDDIIEYDESLNASAFSDGNLSLQDILEEYTSGSQFVYHHPENIFLIAFYVPVFLLALTANLLVIAVFIKYRTFRTITNCFLMNLSISDLLVTLLCMPSAVGLAIHSKWIFGDFICKANHYLQGVSVGSSIFTLSAMSIDRYLAIRHPLKRKNIVSKRLILKVIFWIWIVSLLIFSPIFYVRKTDGFRFYTHDFVFCLEEWESSKYQKLFGIIVFVVVYAVPGIVITITCSIIGCTLRQTNLMPQSDAYRTSNMITERRKVYRTLMILATGFACCWTPYSVLSLILDFSTPSTITKSGVAGNDYEFYVQLHKYFVLIGHFNSLLNPLLYTLLTKTFRNHVKRLIRCE